VVPTPAPDLPLGCQFSDGSTVTLQPTPIVVLQPTPGVTPTPVQAAPGYTSLATGEPMPGVTLDLQLPSTTFVAGAVIQPQIQVSNTSPTTVQVDAGVSAVPDGQVEPVPPSQADPRSFPPLHGRLFGPQVPSGQTGSISSLVQLPFDAAQPSHLHARARLAVVPSPAPTDTSLITTADVPLQLTAPTPDQQLDLEFHADRQQWCLRATTATGLAPTEPLVVALIARSPQRWYAELGPNAGSAGTWAGYWHFYSYSVINGVVHKMSDDPFDVTAWVGGANYVTANTPPVHVPEP
jgi:hypothetical protein